MKFFIEENVGFPSNSFISLNTVFPQKSSQCFLIGALVWIFKKNLYLQLWHKIWRWGKEGGGGGGLVRYLKTLRIKHFCVIHTGSENYQLHLRLRYRSSHSKMFFKIGVLKNFAIHRKAPLLESLFNKVAGFFHRRPPVAASVDKFSHSCQYWHWFKKSFKRQVISSNLTQN